MTPGSLSDVLLLHVLAYLAGVEGKSSISHAVFYLLFRASNVRNRGFAR